MSDVNEIRLDEFDVPPWEEAVPCSAQPPVEVGKDLEIHRKAANFNKLKLISGSSIECPVEEYIRIHYGKEGTLRLKLAKHVLNVLHYVPSDDVLLMLSCPKKARVVIATAGAGKTTSLQLDLIVSKMLDKVLHNYHLDPVPVEGTSVTMPSILYLNYNRHNVQPILSRHSYLCGKIGNSLTTRDSSGKAVPEHIDDSIESSTVHAFCHKWLQAFAFSIDVPELKIASDDEKKKLWSAIVTPRWKKFYNDEDVGVTWETMDELYTFKIESMLDWEPFFATAKFVDKDLDSEFVKSCIKKYDAMKKQMHLMDFTDYLVMTIEALREHPELKQQVQDRYKIIVADENQDFTALMNELLLQLYNAEKNHLIVVGDPDQTIYAFKGVSPDNVVNLIDELCDVEVIGLDTNYRCPDKIVDAAKAILDLNIMRFVKPIKTVKTGGEVVKHPLPSGNLQAREVLAILNQNGVANYGNTVITYRNNRSSLIIGEELYYANIPFSVLDDRRPFNNMVFKHIQNALLALKEKDDRTLNSGLYRFLPIDRKLWERILDANAKQRHIHFHDLQIPDGLPAGTTQAIQTLVDISFRVETEPCSDYIGVLISLYRKYYFDFIMKNPNSAVGDEDYYALLLERTTKFWTRPYTFEYMQKELQERNIDREDAVALSTFHGLKGLEFDHVIAIDFNDSLFPNYFGIEQRYPQNTAMEEKESENRLCYVLVTRAIKTLHLVYQENNPSFYVGTLCEKAEFDSEKEDSIKQVSLGEISLSGDATSAKLSFIQRLTGDRRS